MNNCFFLKGHPTHQIVNADIHPFANGLLTLSLLVTQDDFTDVLVRLYFLVTIWPEIYPLGGLLSPSLRLILFTDSCLWAEDTYPVSQVSLAIVKPLQGGTQIQPEQLNAFASPWPGAQLSDSPWWHLRKHTWGPSGSEKTLPMLGRLLSLWSSWACSLSHFLAFFSPEGVEFQSSSFPVWLLWSSKACWFYD